MMRIALAALSCLLALTLGARPAAAVLTAGNAIYSVHVDESGNVGQYTVTTGSGHPAGANLNVLFGNGFPGTSFSTVRSYSTDTDYVQDGAGGSSPNAVVALGPLGVVSPLGSTGFRTVYTVSSPDSLVIVQDLKVNGTTFADSAVELSTTVVNTGPASVRIGVRHHLDYQVGTDDGPFFQPVNLLGGAFLTCDPYLNEAEFFAPQFDAYMIEDNDVNTAPPTFRIFGSITGPPTLLPTPTPPDLVQFVCWPSANGTTFDYTIDPSLDVSTTAGACQSGTGGGDSAVNYFFGHNSYTARSIAPGGSNTVSILLFLTPITDPVPTGCITRDARFWFTHADSTDPDNATLLRALRTNCDRLDLGFLQLPLGYRNDDNVLDAEDALLEVLGLYYRSQKKTGEFSGLQESKLRGSKVCRERKRLAVEFVAAFANARLLGTDPALCGSGTFPADLIEQARTVLSGEDLVQLRLMRVRLRQFNSSGMTNDFPAGITEGSPNDAKTLKALSRDPTTRASCPGQNDLCESATAVIFQDGGDPFALAKYKGKANLVKYTDDLPDPTCAVGSREAVWKLKPDVGVNGRHFTATTEGSNYNTLLSVYRGTCELGNQIRCNDDSGGFSTSEVEFTTDGTNTYYIVVEGADGAYGKAKLTVTSP